MLFHISEEPDLSVFAPRIAVNYSHLPPVVWAIDQEHLPHYFLPRDCPRVIYWQGEQTNEADTKRFFSQSTARKVIAVENGWLARILNTPLYQYSFEPAPFTLFEEAKTAGYYIAETTVAPIATECIPNGLEQIAQAGIEIRVTPHLQLIRDQVISSTLDFSIIRFRNARKEI
ncbi:MULTISPECIES: DUF6886 family protein [Bacillus]|uniref:Uncharacterized protein n=2 Tax=Bacillus TaxID=1386 RepID=A0A0M4FHR3_9BACI|nr:MULTISPECIES: DUF6886 family protein [Bacillus]ALC80654.1 hypothetical protein AM592_02925 [Bacillus gobiensis]MBP1079539.1 hypothetical protein [Bacillus capparidis]MED1094941.1 hypothetical protein [Bacillus capparidis]